MEFNFLRFEARDKYNLCRHLGEADFCGQVKAFLWSRPQCCVDIPIDLFNGHDLIDLRVSLHGSDYNHQ